MWNRITKPTNREAGGRSKCEALRDERVPGAPSHKWGGLGGAGPPGIIFRLLFLLFNQTGKMGAGASAAQEAISKASAEDVATAIAALSEDDKECNSKRLET